MTGLGSLYRRVALTCLIRRMSESSQSVWITDGGDSTTLERSDAAASACKFYAAATLRYSSPPTPTP